MCVFVCVWKKEVSSLYWEKSESVSRCNTRLALFLFFGFYYSHCLLQSHNSSFEHRIFLFGERFEALFCWIMSQLYNVWKDYPDFSGQGLVFQQTVLLCSKNNSPSANNTWHWQLTNRNQQELVVLISLPVTIEFQSKY